MDLSLNPTQLDDRFTYTIGGFLLAKEYLISVGRINLTDNILTDKDMKLMIDKANIVKKDNTPYYEQ